MLSHYFFRRTHDVLRTTRRSYSMSSEQKEKAGKYAIAGVMSVGAVTVLVAVSIMIKELTGRGIYGDVHRNKKENALNETQRNEDCWALLNTYLAASSPERKQHLPIHSSTAESELIKPRLP